MAVGTTLSGVITAAGLLSAMLFMTAVYAQDAEIAIKKLFREDPGQFTALSVGLWLAFACQTLNRHSAAPSGADTVFFLASAPVFAVAIVAARPWLKDHITWGNAAGAVTALAGAMMIVANWERPSSFSPFVLFRPEEILLLASAAGLALFAVSGRKLTVKYSPGALLTSALWVITPPTLLYVMLAGGGLYSFLSNFANNWFQLIIIGIIALVMPLMCLLQAVKKIPATRAMTAISIMPAMVTILIGAERGFGYAYLPTPFAWAPVLAGITIVVMGVAAVWTT